MKKIIFSVVAALMLCSCSNDSSLKETLKQNALQDYPHSTYKLVKYETLPDVTYEQVYYELYGAFEQLIPTVTKEEFVEMRQREFSDFHYLCKNYEYEVMEGELKDASSWCTEIRLVTEKADSLIANWDNVDKYSYDLAEVVLWYNARESQYYGKITSKQRGEANKAFSDVKDKYIFFGEVANRTDKSSPCFHEYRHLYKLTDEFGETSNKEDIVRIRVSE